MYDANEGRATPELIWCDASKLYQEPYNDKLSFTSATVLERTDAERVPSRNYESRPPGPNREPLKGIYQRLCGVAHIMSCSPVNSDRCSPIPYRQSPSKKQRSTWDDLR